MSRANTSKARRHPFYLYLDEFQTFTGVSEASYSTILSRARKYGLGLTLAHQQTGQISQKLVKDIFGNVHTLISFGVAYDDGTKLSQEYTYEEGYEVKHIPPGEFVRLQTGQAICKIGRSVFPLQTYLLPTPPRPGRVAYIEALEEFSQTHMIFGAMLGSCCCVPLAEDTRLPCPARETDFSVVLFRSDFVLFSEKNHVKVHTNQWIVAMSYPPERLAGVTRRGQTMAPGGAEAFAAT